MQLISINAPIHIGRATVLAGDMIVANKQGVVVVPAIIADRVVSTAEFTALRDTYNFELNKSGKNGTTFEGGWDAAKYEGFRTWIKQHPKMLKMSLDNQASVLQLLDAGQQNAGKLANAAAGLGQNLDISV